MRRTVAAMRERVGIDWREPATYRGFVLLGAGALTLLGIEANPAEWAGIVETVAGDGELTGRQVAVIVGTAQTLAGMLGAFLRDSVRHG